MDITRITAKNFRSHQHLDLPIPEGTTAIIGTNGAGKSSALEAIAVALFGDSLAKYVSDMATSTEMEVAVDVEHDGENYRIRRACSIRGGGSKSTLTFDRYEADADRWTALAVETMAATQRLIEDTLGISKETLFSSAYLRQGEKEGWAEVRPAERKAILSEALGLGVYDRLLTPIKADRIAAERQLDVARAAYQHAIIRLDEAGDVAGRLAECRERIARGERVVGELEVAEREAAVVVAAARERAAASVAAVLVVEARRRELDQARDQGFALDVEIGRLEEQLLQRDDLAEVAAMIPTHETALARVAAAVALDLQARTNRGRALDESRRLSREAQEHVAQAQEFDRQLASVQAQRAALDEPAATCDRCGQTVVGEARARAAAQLDESAEVLAIQLVDYRRRGQVVGQQAQAARDTAAGIVVNDAIPDADPIQVALANARAAAVQLGRLDAIAEQHTAALARAEQIAASLPQLDEALAVAALTVPDVDRDATATAEFEARQAAEKLSRARTILHGLHAEVGSLTAAVNQADRHQADATHAQTESTRLQADLDVLRLLERACSRDGIPALIVENEAIPQLEDAANRILQQLGALVTVELRTQRATKGGDLRDALDIILITGAGERPYETFSGGERTRINLALRIALARLLAARRGADVRLLAIDEPDGLDAAGMELLAGVLRDLEATFTRILLISHHDSLRDAFDQSIEVVRDADGWSRIAGAMVAA